MDKRWKNLLLGLVVVVIVSALWFNFQQPADSELQSLKPAWVNEGFNEENLTDNTSSLMLLSDSNLEKIKSKMDASKSKDGSVGSVSNVYSKYLSVVLELKNLNELQEASAKESDSCKKLSVLKEIKLSFNKLSDKNTEFQEELNLFVESNPSDAAEINLNKVYFDQSELDQFVSDSDDLILLLEVSC